MVDAAIPQEEEVDCPFCKKQKISITRVPAYYSTSTARISAGSKRMPIFHQETVTVNEKCKNCGKSRSEIKDALKYGTPEDHKKALERMKKSGLPTRLEF